MAACFNHYTVVFRPFKYIKIRITFADIILWGWIDISVFVLLHTVHGNIVLKKKICIVFSINNVGVAVCCDFV